MNTPPTISLDALAPPHETLEINAGATPGIYLGMDLGMSPEQTVYTVVAVDVETGVVTLERQRR